MLVEVPERYAATIRGVVQWLERGPQTSLLSLSKRGQSVQSTFEIKGAPEKVLGTIG